MMANGCTFGTPWPEYNSGLLYCDTISVKDQCMNPDVPLKRSHLHVPSTTCCFQSHFKPAARRISTPNKPREFRPLTIGSVRHPNTEWLQRIRNGQIRVDGVVSSRPDVILRMEASLEYHRLPWREPAAPHLLQVLYEDNHVLLEPPVKTTHAVGHLLALSSIPFSIAGWRSRSHDFSAVQVALNKPAGLQVLPGGLFQQRTVLTQLQWRDDHTAPSECNNPSPVSNALCPTSPVHRLGRGTSGVLLCAKTPHAKSRLAADLAEGTESTTGRTEKNYPRKQLAVSERRVLKTYRALSSGLIEPHEITIDQPIGRVPYPGVAGGLYMASATGKPSLSKVFVLWRNKLDNCTLVQVEILTGRPHQIRIHLASIGHPLLGDPLYVAGGRPSEFLEGSLAWGAVHSAPLSDDGGYARPSTALPGDIGYLLHAWRLEFYHPISEEKVVVVAPPPLSLHVPEEDRD